MKNEEIMWFVNGVLHGQYPRHKRYKNLGRFKNISLENYFHFSPARSFVVRDKCYLIDPNGTPSLNGIVVDKNYLL